MGGAQLWWVVWVGVGVKPVDGEVFIRHITSAVFVQAEN